MLLRGDWFGLGTQKGGGGCRHQVGAGPMPQPGYQTHRVCPCGLADVSPFWGGGRALLEGERGDGGSCRAAADWSQGM